jgi:hypothetical protein
VYHHFFSFSAARASTSSAFAGSEMLPCAKSFEPPPFPPKSPSVSRSAFPMSFA